MMTIAVKQRLPNFDHVERFLTRIDRNTKNMKKPYFERVK